jgi:hypothetical protein
MASETSGPVLVLDVGTDPDAGLVRLVRKDLDQAAGLTRQALAVCNRLSKLEDRSMSHGNLANYLDLSEAKEEAARHRLAAIAYDLVIDLGQDLSRELRNLAEAVHRAAAAGGLYELPRLAELLAGPDFEPLQRTLAERNVALDALQAQIDQQVEEVRRAVGRGSRSDRLLSRVRGCRSWYDRQVPLGI